MWPGVIGCESAGVSTDRHGHRDTDVGTGIWKQVDWKHEHKNKVKKEMTTHQTHCGGREAGAATISVVRHSQVQVSRCRAQAGR